VLQTGLAIPQSSTKPGQPKDVPMLALLIVSAIAASLLVELGLMVAREWMEASQFRHEDEPEMNDPFKRTSGARW
jgi:hypothetical protein